MSDPAFLTPENTPSLGWEMLSWYETYLRVPSGAQYGNALRLTDEQAIFIIRWYQVDERGKFVFRRGASRRPKGWGKSPLLAAEIVGEFVGPVLFAGWGADGQPIGRSWETPWEQIAACSEDQTGNTYSAVYAMLAESPALDDFGIDLGRTKAFLKDRPGSVIEPVTASAGSREGQLLTAAVLDETHLWYRKNGGRRLAAVLRRNLAKMGGRSLESTNAFVPGDASVAEDTHHAWERGEAGLLYDTGRPVPVVEDLTDKRALKRALKIAYGDAKWAPLDRFVAEIQDPATDPADARRFYLNQLVAGADCPFDILAWAKLARPDLKVPAHAYVGLGFDGSISDDRTVLWGCWVREDELPHLFKIRRWAPDLGERIDRIEVKAAVKGSFDEDYRVGRMFADPPKWWTEIDEWAAEWGEETVLALDTNSTRRFAPECDRFATALREGAFTHDGDPELRQSLAACARKQVRLADDEDDGRSKFVVVKADTRKIDDAVAAILSYGAAMTMPARQPARYLGPLIAFR